MWDEKRLKGNTYFGSLADAKTAGAKYYIGEGPCKNGHDAPRLISNKGCVECNKLWVAKSYIANREQRLEYARRYRTTNIEKCREYNRQWSSQWRANNPDKMSISRQKRRASMQCTTSEAYTEDDLQWVRIMQGDKCPYCFIKLDSKGHLDHITPLARQGRNQLFNIQFTCDPCNRYKGTKTDAEFRRSLT